jgi:hypothetical protein
VDRIELTLTKDGVAWDNIDSVALTFQKPDRATEFTRAMTLDSGNVWYYDTAVTDLDEAGYWTARVTITDGAIVKTYPYEIALIVVDQP